ncbi:MAG: bifunctional phosphoribosylaminoimidazolecarboxamide formyltransferase/IMP cyclohydrolase, partial [candidate division Zixibacteria bacterium]|nr:bifunctional phosphoribosylaminoimidazolecarboxamide formyltransferase/IMP cyclohydrolase [candidate division Zixibacteria bacterium]
KTLHPKVHAGILYRRNDPSHIEQLKEHEYKPIDLVVVNLYPFEQTLANPESSDQDKIENIDIGGPSLLRAGSKNFDGVAVVTSADQYQEILGELEKNDCKLGLSTRRKLAAASFALTARYDQMIANYFAGSSGIDTDKETPETLKFTFSLRSSLRYGENPHQSASFYYNPSFSGAGLANAEILSGKELSYNNIADLDACLEMALDFERPFACVFKHANPCGAAEADTLAEAYANALACDPLSAFGSIIALNREVDIEAAKELHETQFVECIIAPGYSDEALDLLKKKKNRRLLALPAMSGARPEGEMVGKFVRGGVLWQSADDKKVGADDLKVVTKKSPSKEEIAALLFAWKVVKHTKSNAIVLAKNTATVGIGMGQTSRVDSSHLAVRRAGERAKGAVLASDAFFPMADGLEVGADAGVTAFIQPGGSKRDQDVIDAADRIGVSMVFTGVRHFRH